MIAEFCSGFKSKKMTSLGIDDVVDDSLGSDDEEISPLGNLFEMYLI